jgi:hypothetical protein
MNAREQRDVLSARLDGVNKELQRISTEVAKATASLKGPVVEVCLGRALGSLAELDRLLCDAFIDTCSLAILERAETGNQAAVDMAREQREAYEKSKEGVDVYARFEKAERERAR